MPTPSSRTVENTFVFWLFSGNSITISILTWVICLASSRDGVHGIPTRQPEKRLYFFKDLEKLGVWSPTNYDNDEWRFPLQPYKDDSNQKISSTLLFLFAQEQQTTFEASFNNHVAHCHDRYLKNQTHWVVKLITSSPHVFTNFCTFIYSSVLWI